MARAISCRTPSIDVPAAKASRVAGQPRIAGVRTDRGIFHSIMCVHDAGNEQMGPL